jgi:putative transposase
MALWNRRRGGMVFYNDARSQYLSFAFTSRLIQAGVDPSVGSVGDGYD